MRIPLALIFVFTFILSFSIKAENEVLAIKLFSEDVRTLIATRAIEKFSNIPYFPESNSLSNTARESIFGIDSNFENIMKNERVKLKVYGPFTYDESLPNATYVVIYYDPKESPFDISGNISDKVGVNELYHSFLQMVVTIKNGVVYFHRTPFYIESHHPYVGEYG